ncbi:hypothetical protein D3C76_1726670 [compost metagenome]
MSLVCVGQTKLFCDKNLDVQCGMPVTVNAPSVTLDSPEVKATGNLSVAGNVTVGGNVNADGNILDAGGNSNHHSH